MDVRTLVGLNLRRLRVSKGMSQQALALMCKFEPSYVGRIERGTGNVTVVTLDKLAEAIGSPVAAFFEQPSEGAPKPVKLAPGRKPRARDPRLP